MFTILTVLSGADKGMCSTEITDSLGLRGVEVSERTVRYYLGILDKKGYTSTQEKRGRTITAEGRQELQRAFVSERVGFVMNRINSLAFLTDFSVESGKGRIILNVSYLALDRLGEALRVLNLVLNSPYAMSKRIIVAKAGEHLGHKTVPEGMAGIGTVCSATLNGIFLKAGISVVSRFGGVVEVVDSVPKRFVAVISYEGSSVPPLELFMKSRMTDVLGSLQSGTGRILGSLREIPEVSLSYAKSLNEKMKGFGFGDTILFGQPDAPIMDVPVSNGKVGMVVLGGLNPIAALEEAQIATESHAMATLCDYAALSSPETVERCYFPSSPGLTGIPLDFLHGTGYVAESGRDYWSVFEGLKQRTL